VWNVSTGEPTGERVRYKDDILSVAFNADGVRVIPHLEASRSYGMPQPALRLAIPCCTIMKW